MPKNPFDMDITPTIMGEVPQKKSKPKKRTLGIRDKQILYRRANRRCEDCGRKIEFDEMVSGHKKAFSKGGSATLRNSVCICARCNKLQGTDSWATYMKKSGKSKTTSVTSSKRKKRTTKRKTASTKEKYWIDPITGEKRRVNSLEVKKWDFV